VSTAISASHEDFGMKCPKCGYLGFEDVDRCRNCGYDFSLIWPPIDPELPIRLDSIDLGVGDDLPLSERADRPVPAAPNLSGPPPEPSLGDLPLFELSLPPDDTPLISKPSPPRTPLAVRRTTPEASKLRTGPALGSLLDFEPEPADRRRSAPSRVERNAQGDWDSQPASSRAETAGLLARSAAFLIDLIILAGIDAVVVYFTMRICGLELGELMVLPKMPLLGFLLVQNGGYLVAFTVGGQTMGKMATGIRVVSASPDAPLDLGHSVLRTVIWTLLAIPAGLGFLSALFSRDHRGLHDRWAGTRVVRSQ
jgi:uncharacterized RDD family membrane protein YckC